MFFNKLIGSSFLISNSLVLAKQKAQVKAECENKNAEQSANDLDKIFAESGGIPPDPEEIQEMLMRAKG